MFWGYSSSIAELKSLYPSNYLVFSLGDYYYLDCGMGNKYGGNSWCDPYKTWWRIYEFDPQTYLDDPFVLGGEVTMFSELSGDMNIHSKLWPRVVSLADVYWNDFDSNIDLVAISDRLNAFADILKDKVTPTSPITGTWCEINSDRCFSPYGSLAQEEQSH